jgi:hypothetical protein
MFGLGLGRMGLVGDLGFAIRRALFGDGEQGMWYDLNDLSTLFTDSAGTTPATWGDPIGLLLDKHESDGRGVVNRLIFSDQFSNAAWINNTRVTANTSVAPDGTTTADTLTSNGTLGSVGQSIASVSNSQYTFTIYAKYTNNRWLQLQLSDLGVTDRARAWFDIQNGVVGTTAVTGGGVVISTSMTNVGDGWYRCQIAATNPITTLFSYAILVTGDGVTTVAANLQTAIIWGAQTQLGSTATAYQANGASVGGPGNHRIQSTEGSRPILGRMPKAGRRNELVNTDTLTTQNVTGTNVQRVLSFWGTGTVTLSGTSTAGPLVGVDANTRVSLTFTPTAGTLTLTVSGTVSQAQLEVSP